ncbi:hypothetical protein ACIQH9_11300 [Pseudarthrobacter oxydans]|uniref:hypothetical protein n=1 Tax=Pseudarthrobacter oxydans TaxID=1671 RepID=UPI0038149E92
MDKTQGGTFVSFRDPALRVSMAVVADYAAALTWAFGLLAYVSAGAFMSPAAVVLLAPAVVVTVAALAVRRRGKTPPSHHRSGAGHAR